MTSVWRICFSGCLAACLFNALLNAASVSGRVELKDSKDAAARKKADFSGVVISLEPLSGAPLRVPPRTARIVQKDKTFSPHVLAITVGSTVEFPNYDPIYHNAFSNYNGQIFDVGLYPPGTSRNVKFTRKGVVRIFCNIHSSMSAVLVVLDTPWYATTNRDGSFEIPDVPPGDYQLRVFHERATQSTMDAAGRRITVGDRPVSLSVIPVSEIGYLPIPHDNKYGKPYPPSGGDVLYPGAKK